MKISFILILTMLLFSFMIFSVGFVASRVWRDVLRNEITLESIAVTKNLADEISRRIHERYVDLRLLASSHTPGHFLLELRDLGTMEAHPLESVVEDFISLKSAYLHWKQILLIDRSGMIVADSDYHKIGTPFPTEYLSDVFEGKPYLSELQYTGNGEDAVLLYAFPVFSPDDAGDTTVLGALVGYLDWKEISEFLETVSLEVGHIHLYDADGVMVATNDPEYSVFKDVIDEDLRARIYENQMPSMINVDDSGNRFFYNYFFVTSPVEDVHRDFVLLSTNYEAEIFAPIQRVEWRIFSISFVFLLFSLLVGMLIFFRVYHPIIALMDASSMYGEGNLDFTLDKELLGRTDEFGMLSRSFDDMRKKLFETLSDLKKEKNSLRQKVVARTKALESAKNGLEQEVQKRTIELSRLNQNLENEVEKRTKELQEKIDDLEMFNEISIGRELKMVELKKRLADSEARLKKQEG